MYEQRAPRPQVQCLKCTHVCAHRRRFMRSHTHTRLHMQTRLRSPLCACTTHTHTFFLARCVCIVHRDARIHLPTVCVCIAHIHFLTLARASHTRSYAWTCERPRFSNTQSDFLSCRTFHDLWKILEEEPGESGAVLTPTNDASGGGRSL